MPLKSIHRDKLAPKLDPFLDKRRKDLMELTKLEK